MRVGDIIRELVSAGTKVGTVISDSGLAEHLRSLEFISLDGNDDPAPGLWVVESTGQATDFDHLFGSQGGPTRVLLVLSHVDTWLQSDGLPQLERAQIELVSGHNVDMPAHQHALVLTPSSADVERLRARNENRLLWMLSRGQESRLRQLRGRLRNREQELETAQRNRESCERQLAEALEDRTDLERTLEAHKRAVDEERTRANKASLQALEAKRELERLRAKLDRVQALLEKSRAATSFRVGRATAVALRKSKGNPIKLVSSWRSTYSGRDELLDKALDDE